jgi:L,D-transpeptidase ErfK/SrfK
MQHVPYLPAFRLSGKSILFSSVCFVCLLITWLLPAAPIQAGGAYPVPSLAARQDGLPGLIGGPQSHTLQPGETFLDIARASNLGIHDLLLTYPDMDPWIPPAGKRLALPTHWILPEQGQEKCLIVNIPEMRLYCFLPSGRLVRTFPVGVGTPDWPSPLGTFPVSELIEHPSWTVPPALRDKYETGAIPPGPNNPLGDYWVGLGGSGYGIHDTNIAWSVGRTSTHGCIRLYPEDIEVLFPLLDLSWRVHMVYEPIKIGAQHGRIYVEVHPDIYGRIERRADYVLTKIKKAGLDTLRLDFQALSRALSQTSGRPVDITGHEPIRSPERASRAKRHRALAEAKEPRP